MRHYDGLLREVAGITGDEFVPRPSFADARHSTANALLLLLRLGRCLCLPIHRAFRKPLV